MKSPLGFDYCTSKCRDKALIGPGCLEREIVKLQDKLKELHVELDECSAKDCHKPVFWDYKTKFLYCSPSCRDRDILCKLQKKLDSDIAVMEKVIPKVSSSQTTQSRGMCYTS